MRDGAITFSDLVGRLTVLLSTVTGVVDTVEERAPSRVIVVRS